MARRTKIQIEADSAMSNLNCIHELATDGLDGCHATYLRNAGDCARWCASLRRAGVSYPKFMQGANAAYFASVWRI